MTDVKLIIAGSRTFDDYEAMKAELSVFMRQYAPSQITVYCGGAIGADKLGEKWALENNIPVVYFQAQWGKYGRAAGPYRNTQMALSATHCICFCVNNSKGTKDMIAKARQYNLKLKVINYGSTHTTTSIN